MGAATNYTSSIAEDTSTFPETTPEQPEATITPAARNASANGQQSAEGAEEAASNTPMRSAKDETGLSMLEMSNLADVCMAHGMRRCGELLHSQHMFAGTNNQVATPASIR